MCSEVFCWLFLKRVGITDDDFMKTVAPFGFSEKKVAEIIEQTNDALTNYAQYMKELGVK